MASEKRALVIGINYYPELPRLQGCVSDADDWKDALQRCDYEVDMLIDGAATEATIRQWLDANNNRGRNSVLVFCGHGSSRQPNGEKCSTICIAEGRAIPVSDLVRANIGIILDCCFPDCSSRLSFHVLPFNFNDLPGALVNGANQYAPIPARDHRERVRGYRRVIQSPTGSQEDGFDMLNRPQVLVNGAFFFAAVQPHQTAMEHAREFPTGQLVRGDFSYRACHVIQSLAQPITLDQRTLQNIFEQTAIFYEHERGLDDALFQGIIRLPVLRTSQ